MSIFLGSDNQAGAHPEILSALVAAAEGSAPAYGADGLTQALQQRFDALFETPCQVFLVGTGTAANALILSAMTPPWGAVFCHQSAHIVNDENTAPEFYTGGARQIPILGYAGKPSVEALSATLSQVGLRGVHAVKPAVLSLTNATECGTVYTPDELKAYSEIARAHGLGLHVDGARFSNAVATTGASPADLTWRSGVDALSFGATKNGALAAEAVVLFNERYADDFAYRRKRSGHLWSKHRFLAAQFDAFLRDDLWLRNAHRANAMAQRLADGLRATGAIDLPWPVEANAVFPVLPVGLAETLQAEGFSFYPWPEVEGMVRLVTSFATLEHHVDSFLNAVRVGLERPQ